MSWYRRALPAMTTRKAARRSWKSANRCSPDHKHKTAATSGGSWRKRVASVELRDLTKRYGSVAVVDDISLTIEHGHLVCLLGPSGCGKTTTLRLIAGFIEPS